MASAHAVMDERRQYSRTWVALNMESDSQMKGMQVAVTGGSGRLGCSLVRALLAAGARVRVLEVGEGVPPGLAGLDVELIHGSVLDADAVAQLVEGAQRVYHLAAKLELDRDRDGSVWAVNVEGTRNIAEACLARDIRLVHCSSHHALVLEPLSQPLDESKPLALTHKCDYHRSKAHGEKLVHDMIAQRGLNAVVVNPGTLTGPEDFEPSLVGQNLLDLYHGRLPALMNAITDCADARDVAAAVIAAGERGRTGERYLLTGRAVGMREMALQWAEITGKRMPRVVLPLWVAWTLQPFVLAGARLTGSKPVFTPNMLRASISNDEIDYSKAERELDYSPRPFEQSLRDAYEFFGAQGWLAQAG